MKGSPSENRLISVTKTGFSATFVGVYPERKRRDGNGGTAFPLVKATVNGVTPTFISPHFAWPVSPSTMPKSYEVYPFISFRTGSEPCRRAGIPRIALRTGDSANTNVKWLVGDHLGSTSVTAAYAGTLLSRTLYKPLHSIQGRLWGEVRSQSGALPTKYTYTGQYSHIADFGLMYYVARWYDPVLGRFAQADTIVPGAGNPMAWDRFAYTSNNPLKYTDPTGHCITDPLLFAVCLIIGAAVAGAVNAGMQYVENRMDGQTSEEAVSNIDAGEVIGSAVGGAVFTAVVAVAAPVTVIGGVAAGAIAGPFAGQAGIATDALVDQATDGQPGINWDGWAVSAINNGLGNPGELISSSIGGAISGGVGKYFGNKLMPPSFDPVPSKPPIPGIDLQLGSPVITYIPNQYSGVTLPFNQLEAITYSTVNTFLDGLTGNSASTIFNKLVE